MKEMIIRSLKSGVQIDESTGKHVLVGCIPYNSRSENLGGFYEYIEPTAFSKTLKDGADVKALVGHDERQLLGRVKNGSLRLESREDGLHIECDVPDTAYGRDAYEQVRTGLNPGLSFGMRIIDQDVGFEEGKEVHRLREVRLFECSFCVTFPAYPETAATARSLRGIDLEDLMQVLAKEELMEDDFKKIKETADRLCGMLPKEEAKEDEAPRACGDKEKSEDIRVEEKKNESPVEEGKPSPEDTPAAQQDTEAVKEDDATQQALKQIIDDLKKLYKEI